MKKFQILIIIFIILTLSGLMVGCAFGYFTAQSDLDGSNIDNADDIATTSSDNPGTGNSQKDTNIYYLFESAKESNVDYQATIGNFKKVIEELQEKSSKTDTIVLFLIGHGTYRGTNSYYTLNGYNLSDVEMASMFKNVKRDKLIFVLVFNIGICICGVETFGIFFNLIGVTEGIPFICCF